jgi:hypothetical protein
MMDIVLDVLQQLGQALLQLAANPFYYLAVILIGWQYRRQMRMERKLFHVRFHDSMDRLWRTVLWGIAGGLAVSVAMAFVGAGLQPSAILILWIVSIMAMLLRPRFACMAYAVGVAGIIQAIMSWIPASAWPSGTMLAVAEAIRRLDIVALLVIVALLHLLEAGYVRWFGPSGAGPLFYEGKRGKIIGGYQLQQFWPVPLFLLVPLAGGEQALPWTPLLDAGMWTNGWTILAFPFLMGFRERTVTRLPKEKTATTSGLLLVYSLLLLALAIISYLWPPFAIAACVLCILMHEAVIVFSRWDESRRSPFFVHNSQGLKILAVIPRSPAAELGIAAGEIIHKVNGTRVNTKEQLHHALTSNPAFCRMEIMNLDGQNKFVQRALYSGEHHQLGLLLAPDDDAQYYARDKESNPFGSLKAKWSGLPRSDSRKHEEM